MNAFAERWVLSVKAECLDRMILFGRGHPETVLHEFMEHYHAERPHQGLGNELVAPATAPRLRGGAVVEAERLGGLLRSYRRAAA